MIDRAPRTPPSTPDFRHPVWLWLDPTTRCNLACRLCYTKESHGMQDMRPEDLHRALTTIAESPAMAVHGIHLNWRGEPLMNPRFHELLAVCAEVMPTVRLQWHTNGTMLTARRAREILSVPFAHKIFVSIDGGNALSHDLNRGPGTFRKTMKGLKTLLAHVEATGADHLEIGIYQIDLGEPESEYDPEFLDLIERVDDHVKVKPLLPGGAEHAIEQIDAMESDEALNRLVAQELSPRLPVPSGPCFWAGHVMCLAPDGQTWICVISHGPDGVVGNLFDEPPEVVLDRAIAFRQRLISEGRQSVRHCATCRKPEGEVFRRHLAAATA